MASFVNWKRLTTIALAEVAALALVKAVVRLFPFGDIAFLTVSRLSTSLLVTLSFLWIQIVVFCATVLYSDFYRQNQRNIQIRIGKRKAKALLTGNIVFGALLYETLVVAFSGLSYWKPGLANALLLIVVLVVTGKKIKNGSMEVLMFIGFTALSLLANTLFF